MNKKITVAGSINIDIVMKTQRLPKIGESVMDGQLFQEFGGKGANQAVAAARAGGEVKFIGCAGADKAETIIQNLKNDKIDCSFIYTDDQINTGTALIMVDEQGNNYLSVCAGANMKLSGHHIAEVYAAFGDADVVLLQCETSLESIYKTINTASKLGKFIILNIAPPVHLEKEALAKASVIVVNETEAAFLTGIQVKAEAEIKKAATILFEKGCKAIIFTMGEKGAYLATPEEILFIEAFKVDAADTTAAGDVFCGCLAVALAENKTLKNAAIFASAASALTVTKTGAQSSIPFRENIEIFLKERNKCV